MTVVDLLPYLQQAHDPASNPAPDQTHELDTHEPGPSSAVAESSVVALNNEARLFDVLAKSIEGTAVGWSDGDLAKLEHELRQRYANLVGGRQAIRKLIRLASVPSSM